MTMQSKKYSFCNCNIEIKHNTPILSEFSYNLFLGDFETPDFSFEVKKVDSLPPKTGVCIFENELNCVYLDGDTRKNYTRFWDNEELCAMDYTCKINENTLYASCSCALNEFHVFEGLRLPELLLKKKIGLLHCSFIEHEGQAILFAGDRQVGKSTQAGLWEKYASATVINGDRAGIFIQDRVAFAGGVPYSGTSGICVNKQMPIKAIVCLAQGDHNQIERLSPIKSFMWLLGKFTYNTWNSADVDAVSELLATVVENVPVYRYSCVKDKSAVEFLRTNIERMA